MSDCIDCGEPRGSNLFLWLDDKTWEQIGCQPSDFLCAHCIVDRLTRHCLYAYLVPGEGTHEIKYANATITMSQKHKRLLAAKA